MVEELLNRIASVLHCAMRKRRNSCCSIRNLALGFRRHPNEAATRLYAGGAQAGETERYIPGQFTVKVLLKARALIRFAYSGVEGKDTRFG